MSAVEDLTAALAELGDHADPAALTAEQWMRLAVAARKAAAETQPDPTGDRRAVLRIVRAARAMGAHPSSPVWAAATAEAAPIKGRVTAAAQFRALAAVYRSNSEIAGILAAGTAEEADR